MVDEASTIGTLDLSRLVALTGDAKAKLVLAGDPAQHSSVPAGGGFAALLKHRPSVHGELHTARRQAGPELAGVEAALAALRQGNTDVALHRLVVDGRIDAELSVESAYDAIARDWYQDRLRLRQERSGAGCCMIAERHNDRLNLIRRARSLLQASGELHGPTISIGDHEFQTGDEVLCRTPAHDLFPPGDPDRYLRNGTLGRVVKVECDKDYPSGLLVDFDYRGPIHISMNQLQRDTAQGSPGLLTHSYALTSHAAQGATYETARVLATEQTRATSLYVSASRAKTDLRVYTTDRRELEGEPSPFRASQKNPLHELAQSLRRTNDRSLASELDPSLNLPSGSSSRRAPSRTCSVALDPDINRHR